MTNRALTETPPAEPAPYADRSNSVRSLIGMLGRGLRPLGVPVGLRGRGVRCGRGQDQLHLGQAALERADAIRIDERADAGAELLAHERRGLVGA